MLLAFFPYSGQALCRVYTVLIKDRDAADGLPYEPSKYILTEVRELLKMQNVEKTLL